MSKLMNFPRHEQRPAPHPAVVKMQALTSVLSDLDLNLQSQDDRRRALWILDLTNRCVRIILTDFKDDPHIGELIRQAEEITASIERARCMVQNLGRLPTAAVP
jgi:hypothetical protein